MKRLLALLLVFLLIFGILTAVVSADDDLVKSQYFKIRWLVDNDYVIGRKINEDGSPVLELESNITRAEVTKLLVHSLDLEDMAKELHGKTVPFPDVDEEHWANGYIAVASSDIEDLGKDKRLIIGYEDGNFYPENDVSYGELAAMLVRMVFGEQAFLLDSGVWPDSYLEVAEKSGILRGIEFEDSEEAIRREEAFEMIYNGLNPSNLDINITLPEPEEEIDKPTNPNSGGEKVVVVEVVHENPGDYNGLTIQDIANIIDGGLLTDEQLAALLDKVPDVDLKELIDKLPELDLGEDIDKEKVKEKIEEIIEKFPDIEDVDFEEIKDKIGDRIPEDVDFEEIKDKIGDKIPEDVDFEEIKDEIKKEIEDWLSDVEVPEIPEIPELPEIPKP